MYFIVLHGKDLLFSWLFRKGSDSYNSLGHSRFLRFHRETTSPYPLLLKSNESDLQDFGLTTNLRLLSNKHNGRVPRVCFRLYEHFAAHSSFFVTFVDSCRIGNSDIGFLNQKLESSNLSRLSMLKGN